MHGARLCCSARWCCLAVYIHLYDQMPGSSEEDVGALWHVWLFLGSVAPLLFPHVVCSAFLSFGEGQHWRVFPRDVLTTFAVLLYLAVTLTGVDLSGAKLMEVAWVTPWHALDGRSYGGADSGIKFDLMTSMPCWRGNSFWMLSVVFVGSCMLSTVLVSYASWGSAANRDSIRDTARRMVFGCAAMLMNCQALPLWFLALGFSVTHAIDFFHIGQAVCMALCFLPLRRVLILHRCDPSKGKLA